MADYYKSIYRLDIKLSQSRYQGSGTYQIDFDSENEMVEWADENGFYIDAEQGEGYADGFGSWALYDGCLYAKSEVKNEVDDFISENESKIEIVKDYRGGM